MIILRPHRGSLAEAMSEAKEFDNEDQMKDHIVKQCGGYILKENIFINDEVTNDDRNGWKDTRYVCITKLGKEDYIQKYGNLVCIGMCATDYKN